ncbi:TetR/AcrR family transcriptional regulator [Streptacidiphilus sp. EB129]|uniref:TetR/AcrR family transcriptional regulator n=1 Tax=Streptacidiphilus sp. EB129 TaxID=3156262 RepID=UPI003511AE6C
MPSGRPASDKPASDGTQPDRTPPDRTPPAKTPSARGAPGMIWLRPERSGRGPEPAHSRAAIAAAAIALADADGLDAVSMRKVAAALGAGTMSLYNYVPKKEHLFDLMLDAAVGEFVLPAEPSGEARADLARFAGEALAAMRRHPWMAGLALSRPSMGPNALRCTEFFLRALAGTPLGGGAKMEMFAQLNGFVCQFAEFERNAGGATAEWHAELVTYLGGVIATGRYPYLAATLADSAGSAPLDADRAFERSLNRLLSAFLTARE